MLLHLPIASDVKLEHLDRIAELWSIGPGHQ